jgi:KEOPS complex subunit Cgi121
VKDFPEEQACAAGVRGRIRLDDTLFLASRSNRIAPLQVVRADRVVGDAHLRSAALHAQRAAAEGRMQARSVEVEFARYLAGERQIKDALGKVGVVEPCAAAVVVGLGPRRRDAVAHYLDGAALEQDDSVWEATPGKLAAFGITAAQMGATPPARHLDLVLEAVAAVDLAR